MRRIFQIILFFVGLFFFVFGKPSLASAKITVTQKPLPVYANSESLTLTFTSDTDGEIIPNQDYTFAAWKPNVSPDNGELRFVAYFFQDIKSVDGRTLIVTRDNINNTERGYSTVGSWSYKIWLGVVSPQLPNEGSFLKKGLYSMFPPQGPSSSGLPGLKMDSDTFQAYKDANLYILNAQPNQGYSVWFDGEPGLLFTANFSFDQINNGAGKIINVGAASDNPKKLCLTQANPFWGINSTAGFSCDFSLPIKVVAVLPTSLTPKPIQSNEVGIPTGPPPTAIPPTPIAPSPPCSEWVFIPASGGTPTPIPVEPTQAAAIWQDSRIIKKCASVSTGLGIDIKTNPVDLVKSVFGVILSLSGGIALILIIISGYQLIFSQGNPEQVKAAQERLTSAIVGLLFIIFSLVILQIIGADILKIPGFTP